MVGKGTVRIASVLIYSSLCPLSVNTFSCAQSSVDDYDVRISLHRPSDLAEREMQQPPLAFPSIAVPPTVGSVRELLLSVHVLPDSEATALVYALNPDLRDPLRPSEKVRIIQIQSTPQIEAAISSGFLLKIHYDDKIIRDLISSRENLGTLAARASALTPERFDDANVRQTALSCISSISHDFGQIAHNLETRNQPTNHEMLLQVGGDIELFTQTLRRITKPAASVTPADAATLCAVAKDLKIKQAGFHRTRGIDSSPSPWPQALVQVRTVNAQTGKPVPLLTIHFVPEALETLKERDKVFPTLSSPTEWYLPEADYILWATQSENTAPLGRVRTSVRKTGDSQPFVVDIPVKQ